MVGKSGASGEGCALATANARKRPILTRGVTDDAVANMSCTCPLTNALTAEPLPR